MQVYQRSLLLTISLLFFCVSFYAQKRIFNPRPLDANTNLTTIAFGSCNNQAKAQTMWTEIAKNKPQLWIWMGDIVYADTEDMRRMADQYQKVKVNEHYQRFISQSQIIGVWDDHDYGVNDGYSTFPMKAQSKGLMFDFLDVPDDHPARKRDGAYQSYTFGEPGKKVKIILLDTRYFRDALIPNPEKDGPRYLQNKTGDVLGFKQWQWLEKELSKSDAQVHILVSSVQILAKEHHFEKWDNFPSARYKLIKLLSKTNPSNLVMLSGDRHMAEIAMAKVGNIETPIYEITSSGLTHTWSEYREEPNQFRVGDLIAKKNFGILQIDWTKEGPKLSTQIRGVENKLHVECILD